MRYLQSLIVVGLFLGFFEGAKAQGPEYVSIVAYQTAICLLPSGDSEGPCVQGIGIELHDVGTEDGELLLIFRNPKIRENGTIFYGQRVESYNLGDLSLSFTQVGIRSCVFEEAITGNRVAFAPWEDEAGEVANICDAIVAAIG